MPDQDPIGLEDKEKISRNLLQDLEKMIPRKGRLVPADPDLPEPLFVCNAFQVPGLITLSHDQQNRQRGQQPRQSAVPIPP